MWMPSTSKLAAFFVVATFASSALAETPPTASFEPVDEPKTGTARFTPPSPAAPTTTVPPLAAPPPAPAAPTVGDSPADAPRRLPPLFEAPPPRANSAAPTVDASRSADAERVSDLWMWSIEGVTRAPVDAGFQTVFETPVGLRFGAGYGWVPSPYLSFVTRAAGSGDAGVVSSLSGGRTLRGLIGIRPSRKVGVTLDAGYARVRLNGVLDDPGSAVGVSVGSYDIESNLDMWFAEIGYQGHLGRHAVLGVGVGIMGTIDASTSATPRSGAQNSTSQALTDEATQTVDSQIERYGFVPTLTLRLGFDLI